jgi:hypothetical protein
VRDQLLAQLGDAIAGTDALPAAERERIAGELGTQPGYRRFLRRTKAGLLRIDRAAVAAEAHLDGKFLLRTSDPTLSAEDVALGYKQLLEGEAGLAGHEVHPGAAPGLPPPGGAHPGPRHLVLPSRSGSSACRPRSRPAQDAP